MRYSLLAACGLAAVLLLAPGSASALESCYQICNANVPCSTPCIDPYRPYLGPLACGAGFSCRRGASVGGQDGLFENEGILSSEINREQATCKNEPGDDSLLLPPSPPQGDRVPTVQPGR